MFTMAKIKDRNTINGLSHKSNYLNSHLIHNDYYSESNTVNGVWIGELSEILEIKNLPIKQGDEIFELLRRNINPLTGEKLTPRNRPGGNRFFDFQCSAQKSVSVMAVTFDDERLREAHEEAFNYAFKELEKFAACRDNSKKGIILEPKTTGNLCAAVFQHDASRSLDAQLHSHSVVANATYDPETGRIVALETKNIIKAIRYAGKVYQNQLAVNVRKLGYEIEEKINSKGIIEGFEIKGVPEEILKRFSKRRSVIESQIEKFVEKYGRKPTTAEIHVITKESRNKKLSEITTKEVIDKQLSQLTPEEKSALLEIKKNAIYLSKEGYTIDYHDSTKMDEIIDYTIGHLYSRQSVLKGNQLIAECLNQGLGYIELDEIKKQISKNPQLIKLRENQKNSYLGDDIATLTGMQLEIWAVENINKTINTLPAINRKFKPFNDLKSLELEQKRERDYKEQRIAIREILNSNDKYICLRGVAGAGKTSALSELQKGLNKKINNVVYLSPQTGAKNTLIDEGFKDARTVASFKLNHSGINNGLIIVDEAGLLSNIDGTTIMKIAEQTNSRVLFVGDSKQHKSVAAGDFLRILEEHSNIHQSELNEIFRQKDNYKRATSMMASGDIEGGIFMMDTHESMKWINEGKGKYIQNAIKDYMTFTNNGKNLNDCIFVTPTHKEADKITEKLRTELKLKNIISTSDSSSKDIFKSMNWTTAQKRSAKSYSKGLKLLITSDHDSFKQNELLTVSKVIKNKYKQNRVLLSDGRILNISKYKKYEIGETKNIELCPGDKIMARLGQNEIVNGDVYTVRGKDIYGNIATDEGIIIPKEYSSLQYGFVSTSHKKQGATAINVVIAAEKINKDAIYVASTRGVQECRINVPDKEQLYYQASILTERTAALDLIKKNINESKLIHHEEPKNNLSIVDKYLKKHGQTAKEVFNITRNEVEIKKRIHTRNKARSDRGNAYRGKIWETVKTTTFKLKVTLFDSIKYCQEINKQRAMKVQAKNKSINKDPNLIYPKSISNLYKSYKGKSKSLTKDRGLEL